MRSGIVYYQDTAVGILSETESGYSFVYHDSWLADTEAEAVSLTLPLTATPYTSTTMFPFFDGLIPEGWLLQISVLNWKLDPRDRMGLVLSVCRDCIGAVSIRPEGA